MKKIVFIGFLLLAAAVAIPAGSAHAAITFDASTTVSKAGVSAVTTTITVGAGTNELLTVMVTTGNSSVTTTAVSVDGTQIASATLLHGGAHGTSIWYVTGLSAGSHLVSSTESGNNATTMSVASFFGVNQSSPLDNTGTNTQTSATASATVVTSQSGDLVIDSLQSATTTSAATQTYIAKNASPASTIVGNASYQIAGAAGSYVNAYTLVSSVAWVDAIAAFFPFVAAAPSGPTPSVQVVSFNW